MSARITGGSAVAILLCSALLFAACGNSSTSPSLSNGTLLSTKALVGKQLPGTSSAQWEAIEVGRKSFVFDGTSTTLLFAGGPGAGDEVVYFPFPTSGIAKAFYSNTKTVAGLVAPGTTSATHVRGSGPVAAPSRWVDLSWCVGTAASHVKGDPVGAPYRPTVNGKCIVGQPVSAEVMSITRRGDVVLVVEGSGWTTSLIDSPVDDISTAPASEVAANVTITNSSLALLSSVGRG